MLKHWNSFILVLFILSATQQSLAKDLKFRTLGNEEKLSNSSVNCIFEDSQHLIWIGTWDGLNCYDGASINIYRPEIDNPKSLSNQVVLKLGEDAQQNLWVLTMHGINRYNRKLNHFERFFFSKEHLSPINEYEFLFSLNSKKEVYCWVKDWGLGFFNGTNFETVLLDVAPMGNIQKIEFSNSNLLLILTTEGILNVYEMDAPQRGHRIAIEQEVKDLLTSPTYTSVLKSKGDCLLFDQQWKRSTSQWQGVSKMIGCIDEGLLIQIQDSAQGKEVHPTINQYALLSEEGIDYFPAWGSILNDRNVTSVSQGSDEILWFGTDGDGVLMVYPSQSKFAKYGSETIPELKNGIVRAFCKIDSTLWVGTKGKGLFEISKDGKYRVHHSFDKREDNAIFSLLAGRENLLYIGTDGYGLKIHDLVTKKLIDWKELKGIDQQQGVLFKSVYAIYQDLDSTLWLGTNGYGLIRCKIIREGAGLRLLDFKQYKAEDGKKASLSNNIVFAIAPKDDHSLWIGTRLGGLNLFNKEGKNLSLSNTNRSSATR